MIHVIQGTAWGDHGYRGPKPPHFMRKPHTYRFRVYGLDSMLDLKADAGKKELLEAIEGHVLEAGELFIKREKKVFSDVIHF